jgi:hypothetical protein
VADSVEALEHRIDELRWVARRAVLGGPLLPVREQVRDALTLLSVPAAPTMIVEVHAVFGGASDLTTGRTTRLLRDEERDYRAGSRSRPYRVCCALTADQLAPARRLLALSTWPLERRVLGPRSRRVDFLTAAARLAEHAALIPGASRAVTGLLRAFAAGIPGALETFDAMRPWRVADSARAELSGCAAADAADRAESADRVRGRLSEAEQLFGAVTG